MCSRVRCVSLVLIGALVGFFVPTSEAQCPSGQLDFDFDLGTLDDLLGAVLVDEQGTNLWISGNPPVWQEIPGQVGPEFVAVDNDGNGIDDDDHFDLLAAIINGNDAQVLGNLSSDDVAAIRNAFSSAQSRVRTFEVTLRNIRVDAVALGFVELDRTLNVTTGTEACIDDIPFVGSLCFDVPGLWGPEGILAEADPLLEQRIANLAAAYMTIGDQAGIDYFQDVLSQVTLSALNALIPSLLAELKSAPGAIPKTIDCNSIDAIDVTVNLDDPVEIEADIFVGALDICNALNGFVTRFACDNGFSCQTALLAASGNLDRTGSNNLASYNAVGGNRQAWMEAESITNPPLQITGAPGNQTIESGIPTTFALEFSGGRTGASYNYLWQLMDGDTFSPVSTVAASETLAFPYPVPGNSGLYTGVVCDGLWQRRSQPARLTVNAGTFRIVTQPQDVAGLVPGSRLELTVAARGGTSVPSYQWQFNGGDGFTNVGTNSAVFVIESVDLPDNGTYRCIVSGGSTLTSQEATVEVVDSVRFETPPAPQAVYVGTEVTLDAVIIGEVIGTLNFQWLKDGELIDGATSQTLTIPSAQLTDDGQYQLRISDAVFVVTSPEARLEVALQPSFIQQPQGGAGFEGNDFTFSVQVSGGLTFLNYQWFFLAEGAKGVGAEPVPVGENSPELVLENLIALDQGNYFVVVEDLLSTITSDQAFLGVFPPFDIVEQPESAVLFVGQSVTFSVRIDGGTGTINYQWQKDGQNVGPNAASLTIDDLTPADEGRYRCVVSDDNGQNVSETAVLDVRERLRFSLQPVDSGAYIGNSVSLEVDTTGGIGEPSYVWKRGDEIVGEGPVFTIEEAALSDIGLYFCEASDDFDTIASEDARITVAEQVAFTQNPSDAARFEADAVSFSVSVTGGLGELNYQWFKDNVPLPATEATLNFRRCSARTRACIAAR